MIEIINNIIQLCQRKYCIEDLRKDSELSLIDIMQIRNIAKLAVIDDDEAQSGMPIVNSLRTHGFKEIQYFSKLERVQDVDEFDIILCDIQGVGESLGFENGFELAEELKRLYPTVGIIAFSANIKKYSADLIDGIFPKDIRVSKRNEIIDKVAKKIFNPIDTWIKIRATLLSNNVNVHVVAQLENLYVRKIIKREALKEDDIQKVLKDISLVSTIVNHLIKLSTIGI